MYRFQCRKWQEFAGGGCKSPFATHYLHSLNRIIYVLIANRSDLIKINHQFTVETQD